MCLNQQYFITVASHNKAQSPVLDFNLTNLGKLFYFNFELEAWYAQKAVSSRSALAFVQTDKNH